MTRKGDKEMLQYQIKEEGFTTSAEYGDLKISGQGTHGYRPYMLMVSSIVGCSGLTLRGILEKMRLSFEDIQITADIERNPEIANRIEKIQLTYTVISTDATEEKLKKALKLSHNNCGMIQSVKDSITITESIEKN